MAKKTAKKRASKTSPSKAPVAKKAKKKATKRRPTKKVAKKTSKKRRAPVEVNPCPPELMNLPDDAMIILAARGMLLFPRVVLPIVVGRESSVAAVQAAVADERPIGILLQRDESIENPEPDDLFEVGTEASIVRYITAPDGSHHVIAQGEARFRVIEYLRTKPYLIARVETIFEQFEEEDDEIEARTVNLKAQAHRVLSLLPQKPEDLDNAIEKAEDATTLTDLVATFIDIDLQDKQDVLETTDLRERMDKVSALLTDRIKVLSISAELREKAQGKMEKAQRDYFLREQLGQIQTELGEGHSVEQEELGASIESSRMPAPVKKEARRDLARLERMHESAAEAGVLRSYLECLLELPWGKKTRDNLDLASANEILDEDHFGLEKIKRRILEFLAVRKLKPDGKGPILCFVGPPGVGKTSLGRSIARALGRKFVRLSMGGVHDEAAVRGHRRTYVGAMPGSIMEHIRRAKSMNPVFMLDELDKLGKSAHGDPSSALLEVLDPEQNDSFTDHYLNVPFDLSRVFFVGTANVLDSIPGPLRDRCEVVELSGYTRAEKLEIVRRYLVERQRDNHGVSAKQFVIDDDALRAIISSYTREAGCRGLEREIAAVARHSAARIVRGDTKDVRVTADDLHGILGPVRVESELALRTSQPGVATGLAWTPVGGEILFVEATSMAGKGDLILTGQLGDVMKESARAAHSLVRSNADALGITAEQFSKNDIHIHIPAGAIPKDGPSAGVAIYTALVSLLTNTTVHSRIAMTGEISLRGLVMPVGGIKDKVLAAHQAGIETVLLPARNRKDFEEIPEIVREELRFLWIENVDEALDAAFGRSQTKRARSEQGDGPPLAASKAPSA